VTSLHEVLHGVIALLSRLIPKRIELELHADAQNDTVLVDPGQLQELLTSLILNSRMPSPATGPSA